MKCKCLNCKKEYTPKKEDVYDGVVLNRYCTKKCENEYWQKQLRDMSRCADCGAPQIPKKTLDVPGRDECVNRCGAYVFYNTRLKEPCTMWASENWG